MKTFTVLKIPLFLALIVALSFSLLTPTLAFAEGESPEITPAPGDVPVSPETPVEETTTPSEEDVTSGSSNCTLPIIVETLSMKSTDILLVDNAGTALPLASTAALETLQDPDPYFYMDGIPYEFSASDCNPDIPDAQPCDNPIQAAINYLAAKGWTPDDNKVYIEAGTYATESAINPSSNIFIDGDSWVTTAPSLLIISGAGNETDDTTNTLISGSITLQNMHSFTLSGINLTGTFLASTNIGTLTLQDVTINNSNTDDPSADGLEVIAQSGAVNLTNVTVTDSDQDGADIQATSTVTVKNSTFSGNAGNGLNVVTPKNVVLDKITTSLNVENGISVDTSSGTGTVSMLSIIGESISSDNDGIGLIVLSKGTISINGLSATLNDGGGAELDNTFGSGSVVLQNSHFDSNKNNGLQVNSNNTITLSQVSANLNTDISGSYYGASLVNISAPTLGRGISITNGSFNLNGASGLMVLSQGNILLDTVDANDNGAFGATISNDVVALYPPSVKITRSEFSGNTTYGLNVLSRGTITLNQVHSVGNLDGYGVNLDNLAGLGSINILNTLGENIISGNTTQTGLIVTTRGTITIRGLTASGNLKGAELTSNVLVRNILVYDSIFSDNIGQDVTPDYGLLIFGKGYVRLENVTASGNLFGGDGVTINNTTGTSNVLVINSDFNSNTGNGLAITSNGQITLDRVSASSNTLIGALLNNNGTLVRNVILAGTKGENTFNQNTGSGLEITSRAAVSLRNVTVLKNAGNGIVIDSTFGTGSVGITNANISYNTGANGLLLHSNGVITLNKVTANNNQNGADVINLSSGRNAVGINILQSVFNNNANWGIVATSYGRITVNNITAIGNQGPRAVVLQNVPGMVVGVVIASSLGENNISNNTGMGLEITTSGSVTLNRVIASYNGGIGANLPNQIQGLGYASILNSFFDHNGDTGLVVQTMGAITLTDVSASNNVGGDQTSGAYLAGGSYNIRVTRGVFNNNSGSGLIAIASGPITLNSIYANDNAHSIPKVVPEDAGVFSGVFLKNDFIDLTSGISIYNSYWNNQFNRNTNLSLIDATTIHPLGYGLRIFTNGLLNVRGVTASENGQTGLSFFKPSEDTNESDAFTNHVSISNSTFENNRQFGILVQTLGRITLSGVIAGNTADTTAYNYGIDPTTEGFGAYLVNDLLLTSLNRITILNSKFDNNSGPGLYVVSEGRITLTNVTAIGNTSIGTTPYGVYLSNVNSPPDDPAGISISGGIKANRFSDNAHSTGLFLNTLGTLYLTNIQADNNGKSGIYFMNVSNTNQVTLRSIQTNNNALSGMYIRGKGIIYADRLAAFQNGYHLNDDNLEMDFLTSAGVYLSNSADSTGKKPVTVYRSVFSNNFTTGLRVYSNANIIINAVQANGNQTADLTPPVSLRVDGVYLSNSSSSYAVNVYLYSSLGSNRFDNNRDYGLHVFARQNITITSATAIGNGISDPAAVRSGINLVAYSSTSVIRVNCTSVTGSGLHGLWAEFLGGVGSKFILYHSSLTGNAVIDGNGENLNVDGATTTTIIPGFCSGW